MTKLALLIMLMAPALLQAQELCTSSWTVQSVSVASHTATQIDTTARLLPGRKWIEVQNTSTDVIKCSQSSAVTHSTGRTITVSGGTWEPKLSEGEYVVVMSTYSPHVYSRTLQQLTIYCINAGTNTTGTIALSQCK